MMCVFLLGKVATLRIWARIASFERFTARMEIILPYERTAFAYDDIDDRIALLLFLIC